MALEVGTFIDDLVSTNPVSATDLVRYGAGHLRLLKETIKNSFAGAGGNIMTIGADAGTANTIVISPTPALTEYTARMIIVWHQLVTNTGATTINISGLGAKSVVSVDNAALASGDLVAGRVYVGIYDGTSVQLEAVTKNYVDQLAFNSALPAQPGTVTPYKLQTVSGVAAWVTDGMQYTARTSNTILGASDSGKLFDITSGTFSQTFTAAATLGSTWWCVLRNSGTGEITLDPNSTELIDGLSTYIMYPGESRLITCTGTAFVSIVLNHFFATFTASGTFTKPPGYKSFRALVWSGGGSGAKAALADGTPYGAGAGGGCFEFTLPASSVGASETITIGAGGASQTTNSTNGNAGGNSSIGSLAIVYAGVSAHLGGSVFSGVTSASADYASGGSITNTPTTARYFFGGSAGSTNGSASSASSIYGGASGGTHDGTNLRAAGTSLFGGNGGAASVVGDAVAGTAPGGGGGMSKNSIGNSGAGARGEIRIWGIA